MASTFPLEKEWVRAPILSLLVRYAIAAPYVLTVVSSYQSLE